MTDPTHPAAYICGARRGDAQVLARLARAAAEHASRRGWPAPVIYADEGLTLAKDHAPALASLAAAISAGRHDAVLISGPSLVRPGPEELIDFLFRCTRQGVSVEFCSPPAELPVQSASLSSPEPERLPPFPLPCSARNVLKRASLEALTGLFPDWLIWSDEHGWHGRRRVAEFQQRFRSGAPAFCVHAPSPLDLAAQLRWQQAADAHAPYGCSVG